MKCGYYKYNDGEETYFRSESGNWYLYNNHITDDVIKSNGKKYKFYDYNLSSSCIGLNPISTGRKHKCTDGISRTLYKNGENYYVKMKSQSTTDMMVYKKIKI